MALLVLIMLATERVLNKCYLVAMLWVLEEGVGYIFYFNEHSIKLFFSALESKSKVYTLIWVTRYFGKYFFWT